MISAEMLDILSQSRRFLNRGSQVRVLPGTPPIAQQHRSCIAIACGRGLVVPPATAAMAAVTVGYSKKARKGRLAHHIHPIGATVPGLGAG